jgi:uncharacterized protein
MKLHLNNPGQYNLILSCDRIENGFQLRVGETTYRNSLILTPGNLEMWPVASVSEINIEHFSRLAELEAEVIILGTGDTIEFPEPGLTQPLMHKRIGLEVMDTMAACRTYNILCSDERRVAGAFIV